MDGGDYARAINEMNGKYIWEQALQTAQERLDHSERHAGAGPKVAPKRKPLDKREAHTHRTQHQTMSGVAGDVAAARDLIKTEAHTHQTPATDDRET